MESLRGLKQVIFGLAVVGFGMVLAVASLVWVILDIAPYLVNSPSRPGSLAGIVVLFAIIAALGGLTMAYYGVMRHD